MKILIESDVYNICNRIKKFDLSYRLVFDTTADKYEVYSTKIINNNWDKINGVLLSYVCGLPYKELDVRTIKYLYDTSVENLENIIKQIDSQNQYLENQSQLNIKNNSLKIVENKLRQLT